MARNSSGTHYLPAGTNPVVAGTTITPTWANGTLDDISAEITDSLSRSGKGGMNAALKGTDGAVGAPAFSFTNEATSGWFRHTAGELRLSILNTYRLAVTAVLATFNSALSVLGTLTASGKVTAQAGLDVTGQVGVIDDGGTSKKVTIDAPTGLAANYGLTLPTALPGSTLPVTLTNAGVISTGQIVNAQQNFGTPSAATDVVIKSYLGETTDTPTAGTNINISALVVYKAVGVVNIHGQLIFGGTAFSSGNTILTLSAGYRPAQATVAFCAFRDISASKWCLCNMEFNSSGAVIMRDVFTLDGWTGASPLPTALSDIIYFAVSFKAA